LNLFAGIGGYPNAGVEAGVKPGCLLLIGEDSSASMLNVEGNAEDIFSFIIFFSQTPSLRANAMWNKDDKQTARAIPGERKMKMLLRRHQTACGGPKITEVSGK
jgi:hypothetical protein